KWASRTSKERSIYKQKPHSFSRDAQRSARGGSRSALPVGSRLHGDTIMKPTDIRIEDVTYSYEDFHYRTPIKFGGVALDRATILNANVTVRTASGKTARGFGS